MRAIESHEITAFRDNKNHWKIAEEELGRWARLKVQPTERAHDEPPIKPTSEKLNSDVLELQIKLAETLSQSRNLEALLERERQAVSDLKTDRDHWRNQAERLSAKKPKWWPW